MTPFHLLWLIPVLPLTGAAMVGLGQRGLPKRAVSWIAPATVAGSFVLAVVLGLALWSGSGDALRHGDRPPHGFLEVAGVGEHGVEQSLWEWIPAGGEALGSPPALRVDLGLRWDGLSALMVLVVTFVGFWIHVYSVGYMAHEEGYARYFSYLNLFVFFMLVLVLGASLPVLFIGWEGVGLCSYLLIGFYYQDKWPQDASVKAFVTNRVGDLGFVLGMLWIYSVFGTLHIHTVLQSVGSRWGHHAGGLAATGIALLLFLGATGKSAQVPLYVWLPDAMAGPTPVSALIHAATMVTAGVYMISRMGTLFLASTTAMAVVAAIGAFTAIFAASMGLAANDIKKVLAYSTVSQLGYMVLATGVGAFTAAIFHLMTHAFFKALLFLGAGSVMHAMGGIGDIRRMGGLKEHLPATQKTFFIAALAISGIIPFAGFWSKDEILWLTLNQHVMARWFGLLLWAVGLVTALLTAFYMFRLLYLVFHGRARWPDGTHPHESPRVMTVPLWVLAAGSVLAGFVGLPALIWKWFVSEGHSLHFVDNMLRAHVPETVHPHGAHVDLLELSLMLVSLLVAAGGIFWARNWYKTREGEPARRTALVLGPLYRAVANRWFVDEIAWAWILYPYRRACGWLRDFDAWVVDGTVNGAALGYRSWCVASHWFDVVAVDGSVRMTGWVSKGFAWSARRLQTGLVENYLFFIVCGVFLIGGLYVFFVVL